MILGPIGIPERFSHSGTGNLSGRTRSLVLSRHRRVGRANPSVTEQQSETRGCIGSHLWGYMPVELQRGLHAIVSQPLAHRLDVCALLDQQRRGGVTEAMQPDRWKTGRIRDTSTEATPNRLSIIS